MVDVEQIRRDAEQILDSPDLYRIHGFAGDVLDLLAELEEAEHQRDRAVKALRDIDDERLPWDRARRIANAVLAEWEQEA